MPKFVEGYAVRIKVPDGHRDVLVLDSELPGFGIRKFASGRASYFVKYNVGAQQRRHTLGTVVAGNLKAMRLEASAILAKARLGEDVIAAKRATESRRIISLGEVVTLYLKAREGELRSRTHAAVARYLHKSWKPLHGVAVDAIGRSDVVRIIDDIETNSGKVSADRARTALSTLFAWAIDRGYGIEANPTLNIRSRSQAGPRTRVLTEEELIAVWKACGGDDYGRIVRLLILTGQQRNEIGDLAWPEIDLEKHQIDLPERRTKNKRRHLIPLSTQALAQLPDRRDGRDMLFGARGTGYGGWTHSKTGLDARIAETRGQALDAWTVHDLRRSFVTHISEQGFALPHVVEAIVNHVSGAKSGVAGTYNHAAYAAEKRQALELWGNYVESLVDGRVSKVVPLRSEHGTHLSLGHEQRWSHGTG